MVYINRQFTRPVIRRALLKWSCIGISVYPSLFFNDKIRILLHSLPHALFEFFLGRHIIFKCNRRIFHIIRIDFKYPLCILYFCISYCICCHVYFSLCCVIAVKNSMSCHNSALTRCHKLTLLSVAASRALAPDFLLYSSNHFMVSYKSHHIHNYFLSRHTK